MPIDLSPFELLYNERNHRLRNKDYRGALECYDRALAGDPNFHMLLSNKGACSRPLPAFLAHRPGPASRVLGDAPVPDT